MLPSGGGVEPVAAQGKQGFLAQGNVVHRPLCPLPRGVWPGHVPPTLTTPTFDNPTMLGSPLIHYFVIVMHI